MNCESTLMCVRCGKYDITSYIAYLNLNYDLFCNCKYSVFHAKNVFTF